MNGFACGDERRGPSESPHAKRFSQDIFRSGEPDVLPGHH
jgi:hypothetical protein